MQKNIHIKNTEGSLHILCYLYQISKYFIKSIV